MITIPEGNGDLKWLSEAMQARGSEELLALAEAFWRYEAEGIPALKNVRDQHSFTEQSETTQAKWLGYARVALHFRSAALPKPAENTSRDTILSLLDLFQSNIDQIDVTPRRREIITHALGLAAKPADDGVRTREGICPACQGHGVVRVPVAGDPHMSIAERESHDNECDE